MGHPLLEVKDPATKEKLYCVWSTVCDAPLTDFMPLEQFKSFYREWLKERRLEQAVTDYQDFEWQLEKGCAFRMSQSDAVHSNRAGDNDKRLTLKKLIEEYRAK